MLSPNAFTQLIIPMPSFLCDDVVARITQDINAIQSLPLWDVFEEQCRALGWSDDQLMRWSSASEADQHWTACLYRAGRDLAQQMQQEDALHYHNHIHAAETLVAARWLIAAQYDDADLCRQQGLKLLVAMTAHDLGYQDIPFGSPQGHAEQASAQRLRAALHHQSSSQECSELAQELEEIILGTEPMAGIKNNAAHYQAHPHNERLHLRVLANEADLMASLLPTTGPQRGNLLAQEGQMRGQPHAERLAHEDVRQKFLASIPLVSRAAQLLGLPAIRDIQLINGKLSDTGVRSTSVRDHRSVHQQSHTAEKTSSGTARPNR